jgi:hypothetical protein
VRCPRIRLYDASPDEKPPRGGHCVERSRLVDIARGPDIFCANPAHKRLANHIFSECRLSGKALRLNGEFEWHIVTDNTGNIHLVALKKEEEDG